MGRIYSIAGKRKGQVMGVERSCDMLLNPNCSEIVAKLPVGSMAEAQALLERKCNMIVIDYDPRYLLPEEYREGMKKFIIDPENPNSPDFQNGAVVNLVQGFEGDDMDVEHDTGDREENETKEQDGKSEAEKKTHIYIVANQHSQHQLYETIERIRLSENLDFYGYDGGSDFEEYFTEWRTNGGIGSVPDYQKKIRATAKAFFMQEAYEGECTRMFELMGSIAGSIELRKIQKKYIEHKILGLVETEPQLKTMIEVDVERLQKKYEKIEKISKQKLREMSIESFISAATDAIICCIFHKEVRVVFLNDLWFGGDGDIIK